MNDTQQATEVWTVPGWDEELRCESKHADPKNPITKCGEEVTHYATVTCRGLELLICASNARFRQDSMSAGTRRCSKCYRLAAKCWTVRPI